VTHVSPITRRFMSVIPTPTGMITNRTIQKQIGRMA